MDAPSLDPAGILRSALQGSLPPLPSLDGAAVSASGNVSATASAPASSAPGSVGTAVENAVVGSFGPFGALLALFHPHDTAQAAKGLLLLLVLIIMGLALVTAGAYIVATE